MASTNKLFNRRKRPAIHALNIRPLRTAATFLRLPDASREQTHSRQHPAYCFMRGNRSPLLKNTERTCGPPATAQRSFHGPLTTPRPSHRELNHSISASRAYKLRNLLLLKSWLMHVSIHMLRPRRSPCRCTVHTHLL
jgi:hypothetical protein